MLRHWVRKVRERTGDAFVKEDVQGVDFLIDEVLQLDGVWDKIREDLRLSLETETNEVVKLDGIGSGKSTFTSLAILDCLYVLSLVRDPARVFGLMPGSKIAIVIMSLREMQAKTIIYEEIRHRLKESLWFRRNYPFREVGSRILEFPNRVFILSGSSSETVPIGFNVLVGVQDESDWFLKQSHIGDSSDQSENVYMSMRERVESRFNDKGLMILVSSIRNAEGFLLKRFEQLKDDPRAYVTRRPVWEVKPGQWAPYFVVDTTKVKVVEDEVMNYEPFDDEKGLAFIPVRFRKTYELNPRKFLRDRCSVLLITSKSYVLRPDSILVNKSRLNPVNADGTLADWLQPKPGYMYYSHNDLGISKDKCVVCVGHQEGAITVIDLVWVVDPKEEGKVNFQRVRDIFFELQDRGFQFGEITFDQFQSMDTIQRLQARGLPAGLMSVDKDMSAYDMWLEAHYSGQIDIYDVPGYMHCVRSLIVKGKKVDHTKQGEKDITDAVSGTVKHCRTYEGGVVNVAVASRTYRYYSPEERDVRAAR